ncbi:MAG: hypothetical protein K9M03_03045 [Kiritimatiellales bacterium]|nr:hypothetical protein [Kiritimatiellales bacterium]
MQVSTATYIIQDIENHRQINGGTRTLWYAGIASSPKERLFNDHGVARNQDAWIYRSAGSSTAARLIEKALLDSGYDGGDGGGDSNTQYVYAYKKSLRTNP